MCHGITRSHDPWTLEWHSKTSGRVKKRGDSLLAGKGLVGTSKHPNNGGDLVNPSLPSVHISSIMEALKFNGQHFSVGHWSSTLSDRSARHGVAPCNAWMVRRVCDSNDPQIGVYMEPTPMLDPTTLFVVVPPFL